MWVFSGQDWLVRQSDGPYVALEARTVGFGPTMVEDFGSALDATAKIVGVSPNSELSNSASATCVPHSSTSVRRPFAALLSRITHPLANKGVALSKIAKLLGVPLTKIATIGDGGNDVAMFERSGLSIAMGNASPKVRKAATL